MTNATAAEGGEWQVLMKPSKGGLWLVLLLIWAFVGGVYALWRFVVGEVNALGYLLIFSFPALISFYGLRGIYADNGKLALERHGFTLTPPSGPAEFFCWDRVEGFSTHIFGDPIITQSSIATVRFAYAADDKSKRIVGLTNSLPYAGDDLARIMEYARCEALKRWPNPPRNLRSLAIAALGTDGKTGPNERVMPQLNDTSEA